MKKIVAVTQVVEVEVDESKFTPQFMEGFKRFMYDFDSIDDHIKHIAQLEARGLRRSFIEGYGPIENFGINSHVVSAEEEILGDG